MKHTMGMARQKPDPSSLSEIGARLGLTRKALGYTQAMMSKLMGSATAGQAWENYESGRRRISIDHALTLCRTCGLTLDWIYQGQMHHLPADIRDKIQQELPAQTTFKSRSG
jgi:transcriptional regulator with XRE-family HTH domain